MIMCVCVQVNLDDDVCVQVNVDDDVCVQVNDDHVCVCTCEC